MSVALAESSEAVASEAMVEPRRWLWTADDYQRVGELGLFVDGARLELLEGEVYEKVSPQGVPHAEATELTAETIRGVLPRGLRVRVQLPLRLGKRSEPEPDIAVVSGPIRSGLPHHPTTALLVIEIADSSLRIDRELKRRIYAAAGIPGYWVLDLLNRRLEVYLDPVTPEGEEAYYQTVRICRPGDRITPLAAPDVTIAVDDLLP
jgi:Uma2 family endonuclease